MNKIKQTYNVKRIGLLLKREIILRKSFLLTSLVGVIIAIFGITSFILTINHDYKNWDQKDFSILFIILFAIGGILFTGNAFPAFRNSKKTMDYLLIPNSLTEKYFYEVGFRILLYIIAFPIIFWIAANLAGSFINLMVEGHYDLEYHFWSPIRQLASNIKLTEGVITIFALIVFLLSVPFTGAAFFSKNPLLKTTISLAVIIGLTVIYVWALHSFMGNTQIITHRESNISHETAYNISTGFLILSTLVIHTSSFMRLKEKEV